MPHNRTSATHGYVVGAVRLFRVCGSSAAPNARSLPLTLRPQAENHGRKNMRIRMAPPSPDIPEPAETGD
jgi:hypothetical protein